jgi:hypothetical protein
MKRRSLPIWLLRDVPAFLGVMISFWPLMILVIRNGFAAMRGKKISRSVFDQLPIFLAHAESRLDFALWREAYRRLGWNPRAISFELFSAPESWADTARRFENYRRACMTFEACARGYVEHLRAQHGLSKAELVAHGSTDARLHRAAHHELVGVAMFQRSQFALTLSSAQRARPSKGERGPAHARGPPWRSSLLKTQITRLAGPACETAPACAKKNPGEQGSPGFLYLREPSDQLKPIQRPPAAVATQLRIDITAIIFAMRPLEVASSL